MIRKIAVGAAGAALMLGSLAGPVFADLSDYLNNPGRQQATEVGAVRLGRQFAHDTLGRITISPEEQTVIRQG